MTGAELRSHRKAARLSQTALARRAGLGRHAVQYWGAKAEVCPHQWAPKRILAALGLPDYSIRSTRARGWGLIGRDWWQERLDAQAAAELARRRERDAQK